MIRRRSVRYDPQVLVWEGFPTGLLARDVSVIPLEERDGLNEGETSIFDNLGRATSLGEARRPTLVREPEPYQIPKLDAVTSTAYARFGKRALDLIVGTLMALVLLPVGIVVAIAIRMTGPGVFYRQERVGLGGRTFRIYKFRSMGPDRRQYRQAIDFDERRVNHKDRNDPRHTRLGRFLRRWSLDEIPQLLNVLFGDMSLVGPRPELVPIVARYPESWMHQRHCVRPGITGLWQVSERGVKPMELCVDVDVDYVERLSFKNDLQLLLVTPVHVLGFNRGE